MPVIADAHLQSDTHALTEFPHWSRSDFREQSTPVCGDRTLRFLEIEKGLAFASHTIYCVDSRRIGFQTSGQLTGMLWIYWQPLVWWCGGSGSGSS